MEQQAQAPLQTYESASDVVPMGLIERAIANNASVEVMERLFSLQERWEANVARRAFSSALSGVRGELPRIVKNQQVDFTSSRGRTNYHYEDLADIVEIISPVLGKFNLSFRWRTDSTQPGRVSVTCILEHAGGHSEENTLAGPVDESGNKNAIQAIGSVVTYLQRYTLKAALGIAASRDDDGRQGVPQGQPPKQEPTQAKQPQPKQQPSKIGPDLAEKFLAAAEKNGWPIPHLMNAAKKYHGVEDLADLTPEQAGELKKHMYEKYPAKGPDKATGAAGDAKATDVTPEPVLIEDSGDVTAEAFAGLEGTPGGKPIGEAEYFTLRDIAKEAGVDEQELMGKVRVVAAKRLGLNDKARKSYNIYDFPQAWVGDISDWIDEMAGVKA